MKTDCLELNELVSAYADGELAGNDLARLEAHLKDCGECRQFLEHCRRIDNAVATGPVPRVSDQRWDRMLTRIKSAGPARRPVRPHRFRAVRAISFVLTAAAALFLIAVPLGIFEQHHKALEREYRSASDIVIEETGPDCQAMVVAAPEGGLNMLVVASFNDHKSPEPGDGPDKNTGKKADGGEER